MRTHDKDFSAEVRPIASRPLRILLVTLGTISFILGVIGVFLPILPTTPFLLLAAACYARASARFYNWLLNNRFFGNYIHEWRTTRSIPLKIKILAIAMLSVTILSSAIFFVPLMVGKITMISIGTAVAIYIARIPTRRPSDPPVAAPAPPFPPAGTSAEK